MKDIILSEAQILANKYNVAIEFDRKYTSENFNINFYKLFKNKKMEYVNLRTLNNNVLTKFYKKYIYAEFLEIGELVLVKKLDN